jgi:hypothetical protein
LRKPVITTGRPRRKASWPSRATAGADMLPRKASPAARAPATSEKFVSVGPGHSAVTVTGVPATSSASASLSESTYALVA